jgi:MFS family permease
VNALAVFFIPANLHVTTSWLGAVSGSVGAGAIAGALLAGAIAGRFRAGQLFWLSLVGCGLALIGFSRATSLGPAIAVAALLGVAVGVFNAVLSPLILRATPPHLLGRISAVISPLQQLASIVSMLLAGVLASTALRGLHTVVAGVTFGPYDTVFAVAGALVVIAGVTSIAPLRGSGAAAAGHEPGDEPGVAGTSAPAATA